MKAHDHEHSDVNIPGIVKAGVGLFLMVLIAQLLMGWMFSFLAARDEPPAAPFPQAAERELPPTPRLQVSPYDDYDQLRNAEGNILNSYGWVQREQGIVRIPIERAMDLLVERGLPARSTK